MAGSPDSRLSDAGVFANLRSSIRHQTIAQQTLDTALVQAEPDPNTIPQPFEALPRVSINAPKGLNNTVRRSY